MNKVTIEKVIVFMSLAILFILVGTKLNFIVMMANNGKMPISWESNNVVGDYILYSDKTTVSYWFLGDNIKIFNLLAFSLGDVFILLGLALFLIIVWRCKK